MSVNYPEWPWLWSHLTHRSHRHQSDKWSSSVSLSHLYIIRHEAKHECIIIQTIYFTDCKCRCLHFMSMLWLSAINKTAYFRLRLTDDWESSWSHDGAKKSWDCYIIRSSSLRSLIRPIYCVAAERGNQGPGRHERRDIQHQDKLWPILIMTIIWLTAGIIGRVRQLGQTVRGFNEKGAWANTDNSNVKCNHSM